MEGGVTHGSLASYKLEGQPWLALFHLTTSKVCREAYGLDEYRKTQLMRLRRYIHEAIMDQIPVLGDVARYLDELSILRVPPSGQGTHRPSSNASSSGLLLQRVDSLRESIMGKGNNGMNNHNDGFWEGIAKKQWDDIFSHVTDSQDEELRRVTSEVYGGAGMDDANSSNDVGDGATTPSIGQNDKPQSTVEDWKVALSKPIEKVVLHMKDGNNNSLASFELASMEHAASTSTDTPLGTFRRLKMSISQTSGDGDALFPHAKVVACIQFSDNSEVELSLHSLELPTVEVATK